MLDGPGAGASGDKISDMLLDGVGFASGLLMGSEWPVAGEALVCGLEELVEEVAALS